ncbi:hypothetical protein ACFIJ5_09260 [Haloimpatiens sp. FM7330]|uniref:Cas10/Cmr2 second palm domain-containing protein n=1 Tax=Haloimpatiens sp. FM7330 TaxID=3298610 RepID=UPI0036295ADA
MKFIVKVDIGSKQKYIFSSNRLKEIIGASQIIKYVTENLGKDVLKKMGKNPQNYTDNNKGNILFEAGGNAMYIFDNKEEAINFNKMFSKYVIENFDGLELLMVIKEFNIEKTNIVGLYEEIEMMLTKKKGKRRNQFRRIGYGLTKMCASTRKPAGYTDKYSEDKYISKESKDKLKFYENIAQEKYKKLDEENKESIIQWDELKNGFKFTDELEIIAGKKNEGSYIGITCIDGNGMGKKFDSFNEKYKDISEKDIFKENQNYIKEFRDLTEKVDIDYKKAFKKTVEELIDNYDNYYEDIGYEKEGKVVPIRPIILAGDDITFISNGKIAVEATRIFTEKITKQIEDFGDYKYNLTTSAGIAIIKKTHPFSRGVKLAGALEKNSKKKLRKIKLDFEDKKLKEKNDASFIDWEINRGDTLDDISLIRNKKVARPYMIKVERKDNSKNMNSVDDDVKKEYLEKTIHYNFDNFDKVLNAINQSGAKSNLKSFFRTMNSKEVDAELFYLKYKLKDQIGNDIDPRILKEVVYDAIDSMDLYTYVKGEE